MPRRRQRFLGGGQVIERLPDYENLLIGNENVAAPKLDRAMALTNGSVLNLGLLPGRGPSAPQHSGAGACIELPALHPR